ncbi:MAG: biotin/lipoyl-binding protein, partial [Roseiarcus sp.]
MSLALRQSLARIVAVIAILGAAVASYGALVESARRAQTDAAEIDAPFAHISPTVSGRVIAVRARNDAAVKRGDVLFEIDPQPYQLRLDQARAEAAATQSEVAQGERNISGEQANAAVANEQIRRARQNLELAQQSLDRLTPLLPKGYVSAQQVDQARTERNDAEVSLQQALEQSTGASQVVGTLDTRKAQLAAALATVAIAERDLANTIVRAPFDGAITGFKLTGGEYVITGEALGTIIDTSRWEAIGNFRETELDAIKVGAPAAVYVMTDRTRLIHGEVEGIGWGVRSDESA